MLFPSGMGATTALMLALLGPGAKVAVADGGYYGTIGLLRGELVRWGLEVVSFDQTGEPPGADLVWLEPCSNPMMTFPDLDQMIERVHAAGGRVVVDNTVLSPLLLRPLEHGADFVMHSATKILAGHHDALLGVVACADRTRPHVSRLSVTPPGSSPRPIPPGCSCGGSRLWRCGSQRQSQTALELARRLSEHPAVERVRYPGLGDPVAARYVSSFGPLLSFDVADAERAVQLERSLRVIENATSLGGVASTLEARERWEGDRVPPGLLRLSVGSRTSTISGTTSRRRSAAEMDAGRHRRRLLLLLLVCCLIAAVALLLAPKGSGAGAAARVA